MIKDSDRTEKYIANRNKNGDRDNRNSFESIGINEKDFLGKTSKKIVEEEYISNISKINNDNNNIYSKYEISRLRKNFIINCINFIDKSIIEKKQDMLNNCKKLKFTSEKP